MRRLRVPGDVASLIRGPHPDLKRRVRSAMDAGSFKARGSLRPAPESIAQPLEHQLVDDAALLREYALGSPNT